MYNVQVSPTRYIQWYSILSSPRHILELCHMLNGAWNIWLLKMIENKYFNTSYANVSIPFVCVKPYREPSWSWSYGMVVGFITTYAISALSPLKLWVSNPTHDEVYLIQLYVIKFVSDLQQISGTLISSLQ